MDLNLTPVRYKCAKAPRPRRMRCSNCRDRRPDCPLEKVVRRNEAEGWIRTLLPSGASAWAPLAPKCGKKLHPCRTLRSCTISRFLRNVGFEPYSLRAANALRLALRAMLRRKAQRSRSNLRSPRWRASSPIRLRSVICAYRRRTNLCFEKKKASRNWDAFFLAEKKGFEPSRRLLDLHP